MKNRTVRMNSPCLTCEDDNCCLLALRCIPNNYQDYKPRGGNNMRNKLMITALGMQALLENHSYKTGDFHQALLDVAYGDWNKHNDSLEHTAFRGDGTAAFVGTRKEIDKWWSEETEAGRGDALRELNIKKTDARNAWGYGEMLDNARDKYGELFFVLTLAGKYNQQVGNGGHIQYFDNGYGGRDEGGFGRDHDPSMPLHRELVREFELTILPLAKEGAERELLEKALHVMKDFKITVDRDRYHTESCDECGGSGEVDGEEEGETETCGSCDGRGDVEVENDNYNQPTNDGHLDRLDDRWYEIDDQVMAALNRIAMNVCGAEDPGAILIAMAAASFEEMFAEAEKNREYLIPAWDAAVPGTGPRGTECFRLLLEEKLEYGYLERFRIEAGGEVSTVFRKNRAKEASDGMYDLVREMKVGDEIDYWKDVADRFDEDDEDGNLRQDIREAYDQVIDNQVGYGTLLPLTRDDNGNEITYGYRKVKK
jgi:hypothetical protein